LRNLRIIDVFYGNVQYVMFYTQMATSGLSPCTCFAEFK